MIKKARKKERKKERKEKLSNKRRSKSHSSCFEDEPNGFEPKLCWNSERLHQHFWKPHWIYGSIESWDHYHKQSNIGRLANNICADSWNPNYISSYFCHLWKVSPNMEHILEDE
jgi:hypothetical protein